MVFPEIHQHDHPSGVCTDVCDVLVEGLMQKAGCFGSSRDFSPQWKAALKASLHAGVGTTQREGFIGRIRPPTRRARAAIETSVEGIVAGLGAVSIVA